MIFLKKSTKSARTPHRLENHTLCNSISSITCFTLKGVFSGTLVTDKLFFATRPGAGDFRIRTMTGSKI